MKKFNIDKMKPLKIKKGIKLLRNKAAERFKNTKHVVEILAECILEGDMESFNEIFGEYLESLNKEELARRSGVSIATIKRMQNHVAATRLENVFRVFNIISHSK